MIGFSRLLAHWPVLTHRQLVGVTPPKVGVEAAKAVRCWDAALQQAAGCIIAVANGIGQHLARAATQSKPDPAFVFALLHKRPQFIQLQHLLQQGMLGRQQRLFQRREQIGFF